MTGELSKHYCYHENYFYLKIHGLSSVHKSYQFLSSLFHKFCAATSLSDYDPYLLAATSLYLAGKVIAEEELDILMSSNFQVEDNHLKLRDVINIVQSVLHRWKMTMSFSFLST